MRRRRRHDVLLEAHRFSRPSFPRKREPSGFAFDLAFAFVFIGSESRTGNTDTRRAAAMDGGRFPIEPWNGESENADATHSAAGDLSGKGAFFWLLFFAPAKKSNSRDSAKAFDFRPSSELDRFGPEINTFRAVARVHFFCWPKRNEPKKRAFPDTPPAKRWGPPAFSYSPFHGSVRKRRPSMAAALRVCERSP